MTNEKRYKFRERTYSKNGRLSCCLALASFVLFIICSLISFAAGGSAGPSVGGAALMAMLFSVYGFYIGMKAMNEKENSPILPVIGSISSGLIMVGWLGLFLAGLG